MICSNCGLANWYSRRFCRGCNEPLAARPDEVATPARVSVEAPYGGFWRRFAAYLLDIVVVLAAQSALIVLIGALLLPTGLVVLPRDRALPPLYILPLYLLTFVELWLYFALMWSSSRQATLGKMAFGLKVTDTTGRRIGFARATGRHFSQALSVWSFGIGYAMALLTSRRQALHDLVVNTLVVRSRFTAEEIASAAPAPRRPAWQAVLVALAFALLNPIGISVFVALVVPAYLDHAIRAQVAEGLRTALPFEQAVASKYATGRDLNAIRDASLDVALPPDARYVSKVEVLQGSVFVTYGRRANPMIAGKWILVAPGVDARGQIVWVCGQRETPDGLEMNVDDPQGYTTVPPRYLPVECRARSP